MTTLLCLLLGVVGNEPPLILIRGATLYDGNAKSGTVGDVAIQGEKIVGVGKIRLAQRPDRIIDGRGMVLAPGFIDLHTHSDRSLTQPSTSTNLNYLFQGVTTVVTGNCGSGPTDVAKYFSQMEKVGQGCNVIHLMPHNSARRAAMGNANREPGAEELEKMKALIDKGMKEGAWGMSTGLIYNPGTYAKTEEILALAKVVAKHRGLYASHIRNEGLAVLAAVEEAIQIGRKSGAPVHISHLKASGHRSWGKSADTIALIQKARRDGLRITADQYPYAASSTSLNATLIPTRFREGSRKDLIARLDDPESGPRARQGIEENLKNRRGGIGLRIARYAPQPQWQGKFLPAIAKQQKKNIVDLVVEIERNGGASIVNFGMSEEDVRLIMKQDFVATASDGSSRLPSDTFPHPRSYGCFPRKIAHYALREKAITLEHALRSANGLPSDILQLPNRGYLKVGYYADLVLFDPKKLKDTATFDDPHQYAVGVETVIVNGKIVIENGRYNGNRPGKVLRHHP